MHNPTKPTTIPFAPPREELITTLQDLLKRAKDGELLSISFATESRGGLAGSGWTQPVSNHTLVSATAMLSTRLTLAVMDTLD